MSSHNLSHQQLAMYMTAGELSKMRMGDTRPGETNKDVMARKLKAAKTPENYSPTSDSLHDSIRQYGVLDPVTIVHGKRPKTGESYSDLQEGHHRVASAHDINPKMLVPVQHKEPHETFDW